jgi:hypothetical protein
MRSTLSLVRGPLSFLETRVRPACPLPFLLSGDLRVPSRQPDDLLFRRCGQGGAMILLRRLAVLSVVACLSAACSGTPTAPDHSVPPSTSGAPAHLQDVSWTFSTAATTVQAQATWGFLYTTSEDVTNEATWTVDAPQVAKVVLPGVLAAISPGDVQLTIAYRGLTLVRHLRVFEGESPLLVLESGYTTFVMGRVSNDVEGATVEVISGHNAGLSTVTDKGGYYRFYPPFVCGPLTVRASKAGYADAVASSIMCMNGMPEPVMVPR